MRVAFCLLLALTLCAQDRYSGPVPEKRDTIYLRHADKLIELDQGTAQQTDRKNDTLYTMAGAAAQAKTPMPEPIFLINAENLNPERLSLYRVEVGKSGNRELIIPNVPKKNSTRPIRMTADRLERTIWKVEVQEFLENGEYCISPEGENKVFCFGVF